MKTTLNDTTIIPFPNKAVWAMFHTKFFKVLVAKVRWYSVTEADAEDAVSEAFWKLQYKKDPAAYGDKMPQTEKGWFWALYWQARAYLSHIADKARVHAKYIETAAKALEGVFACGHQGESIDADILARALTRALETLKSDQDISQRDMDIYVNSTRDRIPANKVAQTYNVTANNVYQIVWRVGHLVRKYGPRHFEAALRHEGYGYAA